MKPSGSTNLDCKEQIANFLDHLRVAAGLPSLKALEGGKHEVRWIKAEDSLTVIEIFGRLGFKFTIFHTHSPFASPFTGNLNTIDHIHTFSRFCIHSGRQERIQHIRYQYSGG